MAFFKVVGMTRPGIEPRSHGQLMKTLLGYIYIYIYIYICVCVCVCVCVCLLVFSSFYDLNFVENEE